MRARGKILDLVRSFVDMCLFLPQSLGETRDDLGILPNDGQVRLTWTLES